VFASTASTDFVFREDLTCVPVSFQTYMQSDRSQKIKTPEDTSWVTEYERRTGYSTVCFHHYVMGKMNRKKTRTLKEILPHYNGSIQFS
jgi:hypothetical protein